MGDTTTDGETADINERLDKLETIVDRQQDLLEDQHALITRLLESVEDIGEGESSATGFSRRSLLKAAGLVGLAGYGTGQAVADPQGQVGTETDPLTALYTDELNGGLTAGQSVTSLVGTGLTIDGETLTATAVTNWEDSDGDDLLEPTGSATGIEVTDVTTDTLNDSGSGQITMGTPLDLSSNDLEDAGTTIWDQANGFLPQARLENDAVTVAGNTVSLGGSTGIAHSDLSTVNSADHHTRPIAGEGLTDDSHTFNITVSDFAGTYLSDDGSDNLTVDIGNGLENDGSNNVQARLGNGLGFDGSNQIEVPTDGIGTTEIGTDAVTGIELDLADVAGDNITVDTTNNELDATASSAWEDSNGNSLLEPSGSKTGIEVTDVNTDTLTDNGSGAVSLGNTLDLNGHTVGLSEDFDLVMQPFTDAVEFFDKNNTNTIFRIGSGTPGVVALSKANLRIRDNNGIIDGFGEKHLTINGTGPLGVNKTLDLNGNNIDSANRLATDNLTDTGSGSVSMGTTLDANGNTLTDTSGNVTVGSKLDLNGNNVRLTEDFELDMQPGLNAVEFRDTNNGHTTFRAITGNPGVVDLLNANLQIRDNNGIIDGFGEKHLTINGTGPLGVNKTLDVNGNDIVSSSSGFSVKTNDNGNLTLNPGTNNDLQFSNLASGTGSTLKIDSSGTVFKETSSTRYKTNIQPLDTDTGTVLDLEPRSFEYIESGDDVGLIAEEVDEVLPDIVTYDEQNRPNGVRYDRLGVYLVPEVRENHDRIDDLESDLNARDERIGELESEINNLRKENEQLRERLTAVEDRIETVVA